MPLLPVNPSPRQLQEAYDEGLEGWLFKTEDERRWEEFCGSLPSADDIFASIAGTSAAVDKALLYLSRNKYDPKAFSEENQTTGDCVSMGDRNARDTTRSVEIHIKNEPEEYFARGATEPTYGERGHTGQGMDPGRAAKFVRDYGFLVRQNYPELGLDLRKYNANIGIAWGRSGTPASVKAECKKHGVGQLVVPRTMEQVYDALANGYAGHSGQSWGTSAKTGSDGINRGPGPRWGHDMATVGYVKASAGIWKENVLIVPNSWGAWNQPNPVWLAHQDVLGPWIPGFIIISEDEYDRYFLGSGSIWFYSGINGFQRQKLPDYGAQKVWG